MIEEVATVIATESNIAVIEVNKTSSCSSCNANGACGTSSLAGFFKFQAPRLNVINAVMAKPGDQVLVAIEEKTLVIGSFLLYIVPLLSLMLFAAVSVFLHPFFPSAEPELLQTLAGLVGLVVGFAGVKSYADRVLNENKSASVVKILSKHSAQVPVNQLQL